MTNTTFRENFHTSPFHVPKCKPFVSNRSSKQKKLRDNAVKNRIKKMLFGTTKKIHQNICTYVIDRTASSGNHPRLEY
jgi:hypothetical protein